MHNQNSDLSRYKSNVAMLADFKANFEFPNSSSRHAAVVLGNMLRTCKSIKIYDTDLRGDIAYEDNSFLDNLRMFLSVESNRLEIVVRDPLPRDNPKLLLFEYINKFDKYGIVELRVANYAFIEAVRNFATFNELSDINFAIGDGRAYRLENLVENSRYRATCNFNDVGLTTLLTDLFSANLHQTQILESA